MSSLLLGTYLTKHSPPHTHLNSLFWRKDFRSQKETGLVLHEILTKKLIFTHFHEHVHSQKNNSRHSEEKLVKVHPPFVPGCLKKNILQLSEDSLPCPPHQLCFDQFYRVAQIFEHKNVQEIFLQCCCIFQAAVSVCTWLLFNSAMHKASDDFQHAAVSVSSRPFTMDTMVLLTHPG